MQLIIILIIQLLLLIVGVIILHTINLKNKIEILGLSYLVGSGVITFVFLLTHWLFQIDLNFYNFLISILLVLIPLIILNQKFKKNILLLTTVFPKIWIKKIKNFSKNEKTIILVILFLIIFSFFENYFWPIIDWDALAFYDFRAKVMALNGDMIQGIKLGYFFQYPPYTSFLHVFGYILDAQRVKVAYTFIYASFILTFYFLLRRKQLRIISLIFTLLLATTPMIFEHSVTAYSNLSFTSFYSIGIIYLWFYYREANIKDLLIGAILIGFSNWVRSTEPFWIIGILLIMVSILKHKKNYLISIVSISWLPLPDKIWRLFLQNLSNQQQLEITDIATHSTNAIGEFFSSKNNLFVYFIRFFEVLQYLTTTLAPEFLLIFLLLIISSIGNIRDKYIELLTLLFLFAIIFAGTYVFSFTFETWNKIGGSIVRMSMIFIPLLLFIIAKDLKYE